MPETRYVRGFKAGVLVEEIPYEVSDEQLADEAEAKDINDIIKTILAMDWKTFTKEQLATILQKVCKRLIKKGLLP